MFNFDAKTSVLFGNNTIKELGPEAIKLGAKKILVVTDKGIVQAGLVEKVNESLNASGINVAVFDGIEPNPSDKSLVEGGQAAKDHQADMIVGLGGGSPMDAAKGIAIMANNDGTVESYVEVLDAWPNTPLPVICIPTTAGTGAEVSRAAMVNLTEKKIKKALFGATIQPLLAVVDPSLTLGLPSHLTAQTGVDALCHAVEAYIAKFSNPISDALAVKAIKLAAANVREAVKHGDNLEARSNMLLASTIAVISASSAGLGVVHSLAQTLGGFYNLPHGLSIAVCFPYGIGYNVVAEPEKCAHVSRMLGTDTSDMSDEEAANSVVDALHTLNADVEIHDDLRSLGFQEADLPILAKYSVEDGNTPTNPRDFDVDAATTLFQSMLN